MRASSARPAAGSTTSMARPSPRGAGRHQRGRCADPHPGAAVAGSPTLAVPAELVAQHRHEPGLDRAPSPRSASAAARPRRRPGPTPRRASKSSGRSAGSSVTRLGDPVDPERALAAVGAGDQVPDVVLVDQAPRVDEPLGALAGTVRRRPGGPSAGRPRRPAAGRPARAGCAIGSPQRAGSITTAPAAASASARKVSGSARTSLRSAAFASPGRPRPGRPAGTAPAPRSAVRPLRSVRAPPSSDQPPPRPGCG